MPRPVSWLPRLHEIRRTVAGSVRSHYDRSDLERLFELQPRAVQKLLELLPIVPIGTAKLVEREALASFLDRIQAANDVTQALAEARRAKPASSRRALRSLVRRDAAPVTLTSLPPSVALHRGRLEVSFRTLEELAEAMYAIARLLEDDETAFAEAFEPEPPPLPEPEKADELDRMFAEIRQMEHERRFGL